MTSAPISKRRARLLRWVNKDLGVPMPPRHPDMQWAWGALWWTVFDHWAASIDQGHPWTLPEVRQYRKLLQYLAKQEVAMDRWYAPWSDSVFSLATMMLILLAASVVVASLPQFVSGFALQVDPPRWLFVVASLVGLASLFSLVWHSRLSAWWMAGPPWWARERRVARLLRRMRWRR